MTDDQLIAAALVHPEVKVRTVGTSAESSVQVPILIVGGTPILAKVQGIRKLDRRRVIELAMKENPQRFHEAMFDLLGGDGDR